MDLQKEEIDLDQAERHIARAEHRVGLQALRVESMRNGGHDTGEAEKLLASMRRMTELLHEHRELILQHLTRLRGQAANNY